MLIADKITKRFPGVVALEDVCLTLEAGKVTALVGENGAGKSTLMKILSGVYQDFEGDIRLDGASVKLSGPKEAQQKGIAIIHQELNLIPYLTVSENIFLGRELISQYGTVDRNRMRRKTQALLDKLKLKINPDTQVFRLKVGQQQIVEIAKALLTDARLIIMDEPTSAITGAEVDVLFEIIDALKNEGKAIVYVSHKLDELFRIADNYVILRDGKSVESGTMDGMTQDLLIAKMVGRKIEVVRNKQTGAKGKPLLDVRNLCLKYPSRPGENLLKDISFEVGKGEIVGIFGLMGAGRTELMETLFGLHYSDSNGEIRVDGVAIKSKTPAEAIEAGLALVPEDRKKDGLILSMDVKTNICITILAELERLFIKNKQKESGLADKYINELRIKTPSKNQLAKNLSGGNQQKIVLAKWLATKPRLLLLDEPTRGIDINAKREIYQLIMQLADQGLGIVVVSSELPEILAISDRILVMAEGRLTAEFSATGASEDLILRAAIPVSVTN